MKQKIFSAQVILLFSLSVFGQHTETTREPSSFFPEERAQVLVVGSFHMDYPNLDVIKITDEDKIDVLAEPKKTELTELIDYIKVFKPTKIAIEADPEWRATEKLNEYKRGQYRNERDERFQIAIRLASELNLDYGGYLIGDFKLDSLRGADILSIWWYNRNLRIFRKLQEITTSANDKKLVVFGNGHASILRQLIECSPEYEYIDFNSLK